MRAKAVSINTRSPEISTCWLLQLSNKLMQTSLVHVSAVVGIFGHLTVHSRCQSTITAIYVTENLSLIAFAISTEIPLPTNQMTKLMLHVSRPFAIGTEPTHNRHNIFCLSYAMDGSGWFLPHVHKTHRIYAHMDNGPCLFYSLLCVLRTTAQ